MENHHFLLKLSHFFSSSLTSCQMRTLPDVAETYQIHHENDLSHFLKKNPNGKHCKETLFWDNSPRKCPILAKENKIKQCKKKYVSINNQISSSSNSRWFSSRSNSTAANETDTFFSLSLSSNSGDSFLRKTTLQTIDESSKCSRRKTRTEDEKFPEYELGSDQISTKVYYSDNGGFGKRGRRKTAKTRGKIKKKIASTRRVWMIEESFAVEKSSKDPYSDFRASMVEMIVEKQMVGAEALERLLICFLSLNEDSYHGIIIDVFSEICQTMFIN